MRTEKEIKAEIKELEEGVQEVWNAREEGKWDESASAEIEQNLYMTEEKISGLYWVLDEEDLT